MPGATAAPLEHRNGRAPQCTATASASKSPTVQTAFRINYPSQPLLGKMQHPTLFFFPLHPYKKKTEEHSDAIFAVKCCGGSWLQAESKHAPVPRGERGAGGSAATQGPMQNKDRGTAQDQKDTDCDLREGNVCHSQEQTGNTERGRLPKTQLP